MTPEAIRADSMPEAWNDAQERTRNLKLILASKSPRRQELMTLLGRPFSVMTEDIDETMDPARLPEDEVARVSAEKALAVAGRADADAAVISADTIVVCCGEILGKPRDAADASRMLHMLSGRTHEVMTGVSVRAHGKTETRVVKTAVTFRQLGEEEIRAYIASGDPMDKAGAYGVQAGACVFVSHIAGDFFGVMGLPMCTLFEMLRRCGALDEAG